MGFLKYLYRDAINIASILINGLWCIWAYHTAKHKRQTYFYDESKKVKLDFYPSKFSSEKPQPLILYVHGGGWTVGSRKNVPPAILAQLSRGYAIASISYSLLPRHRFPTAINETQTAYHWLIHKSSELNINPDCIVGWGLSAGAQIINYAAIRIGLFRGVISWYGFSDLGVDTFGYFHPITRSLVKRYNNVEDLNLTDHITDQTCSFYIVHGAEDSFVPIDQSERLYQALSVSQNPSRFKNYPNYYHGDWRLNYKSEQQEVNTFLDLITNSD